MAISTQASPAAVTTRAPGGGRFSAAVQVVVSFAALLVVWELAVKWMDISPLTLPAPTDVVRALDRGFDRGLYGPHISYTLQETVLGFAVALAVALPLGVAIVSLRALERISMPYIVALQAMPKIALGPLFVSWLGVGMQSKVAVAGLVAFFPLLINVMSGLRATPAEMNELLTVLGASRWTKIRHVLIPSAAPYIFAGMSVAVVFALLGAIAAEFVGSSKGLGVLILASAANLDIAGVFAVLVLLSAIGIVLYTVVEIIRRRIVFWVG